MSYCNYDDVVAIKGDLILPKSVDVDGFTDRAAADIDVALSERYIVPVATTNAQTVAVLKSIASDLACGRLILSIAAAAEDSNLQSYGKFLINRSISGDRNQGTIGLQDIRNGGYVLPGATLKTGVTSAALYKVGISSPAVGGLDEDKSYFEYLYEDFK